MNPHKRFTMEVEMEIVQRYINGERSGALCLEYGCNRKLISVIAKRHGHSEYASMVKGGVRGINTKHLNAEIIRLHSTGLSQVKVGDIVGISQSVIGHVLRNFGLAPNNPHFAKRGVENNLWKNGKSVSGEYILILSNEFPSMTTKAGYILEHRLVMARYLGRPLLESEGVHHIDGNKKNNDISNLQLRIGKHGAGEVYCCSECGSLKINPIKL